MNHNLGRSQRGIHDSAPGAAKRHRRAAAIKIFDANESSWSSGLILVMEEQPAVTVRRIVDLPDRTARSRQPYMCICLYFMGGSDAIKALARSLTRKWMHHENCRDREYDILPHFLFAPHRQSQQLSAPSYLGSQSTDASLSASYCLPGSTCHRQL